MRWYSEVGTVLKGRHPIMIINMNMNSRQRRKNKGDTDEEDGRGSLFHVRI